MLKIVNQYWQFDSEVKLHAFLNSCMDDPKSEYLIERYGQARSGQFYAFGSVVPTSKFGKAESVEKTDVKDELNLG